MIQNSFRKHQRLWLVGLLAFIIVPFVFGYGFGGGGGGGADAAGAMPIGHVEDQDITMADLAGYVQREVEQLRQQGQPEATREDLLTGGALQRIRKQLIQEKLLEREIEASALEFDKDFLAEQMKKNPQFQNEDGSFNAEAWNGFVADRTVDWNNYYAQLGDAWKRQLFFSRVSGAARVLERDLRDQFADRNSTIEVKYLLVETEVTPTEAEIQAEYAENPDRYRDPDERIVEFVALSLLPPAPEAAEAALKRARDGEDFAEIAKEVSDGPLAESGGDIDWVAIDENLSRVREPLRDLAVGDVSDITAFGRAYYIFKVEEERTAEDGETREVKARQIQFAPELSDAERAAIRAQADAFATAAETAEDFAAAAAEAGLETTTSGRFSIASTEIENVPQGDLFSFRNGFRAIEEGGVSPVVEGVQNLYVGRVAEIVIPEVKPLEEAREDVVNNVIAAKKNSDEYKASVRELAESIAADGVKIDEIPGKYEMLANAEVKAAAPFTPATFQFPDGLFWNVNAVLEEVKTAQPGDLIGPIDDLIGKTYFLELVQFAAPSDEMWETEWPDAKEQLQQRAAQLAQNQVISDYVTYLEERAYEDALDISLPDSVMIQALQIPKDEAEATPAEVPTEESAPAAEEAPAEEAPSEEAAAEAPTEE